MITEHDWRALETKEILRVAKAIFHGHFASSSNLHSEVFIDKNRLIQIPNATDELSRRMADTLSKFSPSMICSPAVGGVPFGFSVAKYLGCSFAILDRKSRDDDYCLSRRFVLSSNDRVCLVDDVTATGSTFYDIEKCVISKGATVNAAIAIVDRTGGTPRTLHRMPECGIMSLLQLDLPPNHPPSTCPQCAAGIQLSL